MARKRRSTKKRAGSRVGRTASGRIKKGYYLSCDGGPLRPAKKKTTRKRRRPAKRRVAKRGHKRRR